MLGGNTHTIDAVTDIQIYKADIDTHRLSVQRKDCGTKSIYTKNISQSIMWDHFDVSPESR